MKHIGLYGNLSRLVSEATYGTWNIWKYFYSHTYVSEFDTDSDAILSIGDAIDIGCEKRVYRNTVSTK